MSVGEEVRAGQDRPQQSLGTSAARNLATTTKSAPQMQEISSRWLLRMLPWVNVQGGTYRVNRRLSYAVGDGRITFVKTGDQVKVIPAELGELPALRSYEDHEVLGELAQRCRAAGVRARRRARRVRQPRRGGVPARPRQGGEGRHRAVRGRRGPRSPRRRGVLRRPGAARPGRDLGVHGARGHRLHRARPAPPGPRPGRGAFRVPARAPPAAACDPRAAHQQVRREGDRARRRPQPASRTSRTPSSTTRPRRASTN